MATIPTIDTPRLRLRPYALTDAQNVRAICNDFDIAKTTLTMPHPYEEGVAEEWIGKHAGLWEKGVEIIWAITLRASDELLGTISLGIFPPHHRAEMGYTVGKANWNKGYCTEAAAASLRFGFKTLDLHKITATHFACNPASGRVMQKIGMNLEGVQPQQFFRFGKFEDAVRYGVLRSQFSNCGAKTDND
jgi:RimJ/RimL family protein N-acetyltransferase